MALHKQMESLMQLHVCDVCKSTNLELSDEEMPKTDKLHQAFRKVVEWLHATGSFRKKDIKEPIVKALIDETAKIFSKAVDMNVGVTDASTLLIRELKRSGFVFSGFKTTAMMEEAALLLVDDDGNMKPFEQFSNDVQTLDETYNKQYLYSEYKFATASAQMADKWIRFEQDGDKYDLQYRTANDKRVRDTHKKLHNVTLPITSRFWDSYYPPNGWGCRCNVVQVRKNKFAISNEADAMAKGKDATAGSHQRMFMFNSGKSAQLFPPQNPYSKL